MCRGEHCSPAAISGNVRFHGSIWNAPLREPKRPPCVKGAGCAAAQTEGLRPYGYNPTRPYTLQSLRPCGAPAYASGPSVAARHLPTLWGVTLYTREALRGDASIAPYTQPKRLPLRGAPADRRVRGGPRGTNCHPATPQSPSVTAPLKGSHGASGTPPPLRPLPIDAVGRGLDPSAVTYQLQYTSMASCANSAVPGPPAALMFSVNAPPAAYIWPSWLRIILEQV